MVLLLGIGCKLPQEPRFQGISEFQPHLKTAGGLGGFVLGLDLYNPNPYKLKVLAYDLEIFLNGKEVGEAHQKGRQVLLANSATTFRMEVATDLKQVLGGLVGLLGDLMGGKQETKLRVRGTVLASAKGIRKLVPVDFEHAVDI